MSTPSEMITGVQGCGCVSLLFLGRAQLSEDPSGVAKTGHPTSCTSSSPSSFSWLKGGSSAWPTRPIRTAARSFGLWSSVGLGCGENLDFFTDRQQIAQASHVRLRLPRRTGEEFRSSSLTCGPTSSKKAFAVCKVLAVGAQGSSFLFPKIAL